MKLKKMNKLQILSALFLLIRLTIGCIFIWSSLPKISQPYDFLSNVYNYELTGPKLGLLVVITLPWLELFVGICLVGKIFISGALVISSAMATMFICVLSSVIYRNLEISCGCFGNNTDLITYTTVIRASLILLTSIVGYVFLLIINIHKNQLLKKSKKAA